MKPKNTMTILDQTKLLEATFPDAPCGENLEYDALFLDLERAAKGKEETQFEAGEPPDWRLVVDKAGTVLSSSKDMRVAVYLTQGLLRTNGFEGLNEGLSLLLALLERYWDDIHPQLDPDDGNDPTTRVNILGSLCDPDMSLSGVRLAPLVDSRTFGKLSLRDIEIAMGKVSLPENAEEHPLDITSVDAAFQECESDQLRATANACSGALARVAEIESLMTDKVGTSNAVGLSDLSKVLKEANLLLSEQLAKRGHGITQSDGSGEGDPAIGSAVAQAPGVANSGQINSPDDVIRAIDKITDYYARYEPSSPVPLLLERAKRLVSKDFMEILRDLAPDGVGQAENITGSREE